MKRRHALLVSLAAAVSAGAFFGVLSGCAHPHVQYTVIPGPGEYASLQRGSAGKPLALVNARVIDGNGGQPIEKGTLVVDGDAIASVGRADEVVIPRDAVVLDLHGATVLPGLVNAHVHNAFSERHAAIWASCGVTTVRDMSCGAAEVETAIGFRDRARGNPALCRIISAGSMIVVPWGYMGYYGIKVRSEAEADAQVKREADAGVDFVKITLQEPSFPQLSNLSPELASRIVMRAHERRIPVTAHVGTSKDLATALDAGVDDVAHIVSDPLPDSLIRRMVEAGISMEPTLTNWATSRGKERETILSNLRRFVKAGGWVALGAEHVHTAKNAGPFIGMPVAEFLMMEEAGMTPMQIISASTLSSAKVCRLDNVLGTLESGKAADILVVNGDPLTDLRRFNDAIMVIHAGIVIRG